MYKIKLAMAGYEPRPGVYGTPAQNLAILRKHIRALNDSDWVESCVRIPNTSRVEFSTGIYPYAGRGSRKISFLNLPSVINDTPASI